VTVLLKDADGNLLGSGVVVSTAPNGSWVATNRHVVRDQNAVCVQGADGRVSPARVHALPIRQPAREIDLALLWRPGPVKPSLNPAPARRTGVDVRQLPLVTSTGYPTPLQGQPAGPLYTESEGLLVPLLPSPLEGGFDLAYTAPVQKGMSGGGVFIGTELIGINGAHANPLWPGQWRDQHGRAVNEQFNRKLEVVSLGISREQIETALNAISTAPAKPPETTATNICKPI
jgi:hypothetical protein